jgi:hypothetical protein
VGTLIWIGVGWFVVYVAACVLWPNGPDPKCKGTGKRKSPTGVYWGDCRRCGGSGKRVRLGRRIWDSVT